MIINATNELKPFVNAVVGYIQINESWLHHNNNYECAAWWEDSKIQTGVYPLTLVENYLHPKDLSLNAKLNSVVVDDYFPALWGGVSISKKPYVAKNVGQIRTVNHRLDILDSMERTGNSPGSKMDICLNPMLWQAFIDSARISLENYRELCNKYYDDYQKFGDGDYNTNISMIAYTTEEMSKLARGIEKMKRCMEYMNNSTFSNLYTKNTNWINQAA